MGRPISTSLILYSVVALAACAAQPPLPAKAIELNAEGGRALAQGNLAVAEARLSVALEYSPRFVEAWVNLGQVELRRGNFEQARRDLQRAIDLNQESQPPITLSGCSQRARGAVRMQRGTIAKHSRSIPALLPREPISRDNSSHGGSTRTPESNIRGSSR